MSLEVVLNEVIDRRFAWGDERAVQYNVRTFSAENVDKPDGFLKFIWPTLFSDKGRPLDLEIGCGVGWHPIRYASENTDRNLIAIEHTRAKFERFQSRMDRHQNHSATSTKPLDNLLGVHADATRWVTHALNESSIDRCFLLYPNPEPKAPNKRWIRMPFMHRLLSVLKENGELQMATNEESYFLEIQEWATHYWKLEIVEARSFNLKSDPLTKPRTHFEKKYLLRGETCFDIKLRKPKMVSTMFSAKEKR